MTGSIGASWTLCERIEGVYYESVPLSAALDASTVLEDPRPGDDSLDFEEGGLDVMTEVDVLSPAGAADLG